MDTLDCQKHKQWVLEQIKREALVGAKLKLSYFEHIMKKQGYLEKTLMLGKIEGDRARSNMR